MDKALVGLTAIREKPKSRFQLTLRVLLAAVALCALCIGWSLERATHARLKWERDNANANLRDMEITIRRIRGTLGARSQETGMPDDARRALRASVKDIDAWLFIQHDTEKQRADPTGKYIAHHNRSAAPAPKHAPLNSPPKRP